MLKFFLGFLAILSEQHYYKNMMSMELRLKRQELNNMDDAALIWRCVEPAIREVRGKDPQTKSRAMLQLNSSQRAVFLFQVLYGHSGNGVAAFFTQIAYIAESLDFWTGLKSAMTFFYDKEMLRIVEQLECAYCAAKQSQPLPQQELENLDQMYSERIPETLHRIATYIRNHPAEFLNVEED